MAGDLMAPLGGGTSILPINHHANSIEHDYL